MGGLMVEKFVGDQVVLKTFDDQVLFFSPVPLAGTTSGYRSVKGQNDGTGFENQEEEPMDGETVDLDDDAPTTQPG